MKSPGKQSVAASENGNLADLCTTDSAKSNVSYLDYVRQLIDRLVPEAIERRLLDNPSSIESMHTATSLKRQRCLVSLIVNDEPTNCKTDDSASVKVMFDAAAEKPPKRKRMAETTLFHHDAFASKSSKVSCSDIVKETTERGHKRITFNISKLLDNHQQQHAPPRSGSDKQRSSVASAVLVSLDEIPLPEFGGNDSSTTEDIPLPQYDRSSTTAFATSTAEKLLSYTRNVATKKHNTVHSIEHQHHCGEGLAADSHNQHHHHRKSVSSNAQQHLHRTASNSKQKRTTEGQLESPASSRLAEVSVISSESEMKANTSASSSEEDSAKDKLIDDYLYSRYRGSKEKFTPFFTKKFPFSNHYPANLDIDDEHFTTTEQYYMYMKAVTFNDDEVAKRILNTDDPKEQKRISQEIKKFDQKHWDLVSYDIMWKANYAKYTQNKSLRKALFETVGTTLVEASPNDQRWGIGLAIDHPDCKRRSKWRGQNLLGELLTKLRGDLMKDSRYKTEAVKIIRSNRRRTV